MTDSLGFGAMLFGPEHALKIAAEAVAQKAQSTDMAVGIILGLQSAIEEYGRLFTAPSPASTNEQTKELPESKPEGKTPSSARERVGALKGS